jgi:hypothetical protein
MTESRSGPLVHLCCLILCGTSVPGLRPQLMVKLTPETITEFDRYSADVEAKLRERWQGQKNLFYIEDDKQKKQRVLAGEVFIKQMNDGKPVEIKDGLIHDWLGAIYIPGTTVSRVLDILENFDAHKHIYPAISQSHTVQRAGHQVKGYWRLQRKGIVPVILDVNEEVQYNEIAPGKWKGQSYARNIIEVNTAPFSGRKKFPSGEGHGYLWRLYGYWTLENLNGGVLAECRTLSLSRDIPEGLAWAVGPYVQKMPEESLVSTLKETRNAAKKSSE